MSRARWIVCVTIKAVYTLLCTAQTRSSLEYGMMVSFHIPFPTQEQYVALVTMAIRNSG